MAGADSDHKVGFLDSILEIKENIENVATS